MPTYQLCIEYFPWGILFTNMSLNAIYLQKFLISYPLLTLLYSPYSYSRVYLEQFFFNIKSALKINTSKTKLWFSFSPHLTKLEDFQFSATPFMQVSKPEKYLPSYHLPLPHHLLLKWNPIHKVYMWFVHLHCQYASSFTTSPMPRLLQ